MVLAMRVPVRRSALKALPHPDHPDPSDIAPAAQGSKIGKIGLIAIAGLALGLGATEAVLTRRWDVGAVHIGVWATWPNAGSARIDPYARAIFARSGQIPLAAGVGLAFMADRDEAGLKLSRTCAYRLTGAALPAAHWTITALTPDGLVLPNLAQRYGFASSDLVRTMEGRYVIEIAPRARPGNWLPLAGQGRFILMLRLYDTSFAADSAHSAPPPFPVLHRLDCLSS